MKTSKKSHRFKRAVSIAALLLSLIGGLFSSDLPGALTALANTYGEFTSVTQTLVIDPMTANECKRMLNGTLNFSWPQPSA